MAFFGELLTAMGQIVAAPFKSFEALWIIIPLLLMWAVLEVYFARFKKEELGWNTALANGITLGWLTLEGMRSLFTHKPDPFAIRILLNSAVLFYALVIIYFSFTHKIKSKWNFAIASPTPVYYLGTITVTWGFGTLGVNPFIILGILVDFIIISIFIFLFRKMVKPSEKDETPPESGMPETPSFGANEPAMPDFGSTEKMPDFGGGDQFKGLPPMKF